MTLEKISEKITRDCYKTKTEHQTMFDLEQEFRDDIKAVFIDRGFTEETARRATSRIWASQHNSGFLDMVEHAQTLLFIIEPEKTKRPTSQVRIDIQLVGHGFQGDVVFQGPKGEAVVYTLCKDFGDTYKVDELIEKTGYIAIDFLNHFRDKIEKEGEE